MLVLDLFSVSISISMAVFEPDSYCTGYSAEKYLEGVRGLVVKKRDNRKIQIELEGPFNIQSEHSMISHIKQIILILLCLHLFSCQLSEKSHFQV